MVGTLTLVVATKRAAVVPSVEADGLGSPAGAGSAAGAGAGSAAGAGAGSVAAGAGASAAGLVFQLASVGQRLPSLVLLGLQEQYRRPVLAHLSRRSMPNPQ